MAVGILLLGLPMLLVELLLADDTPCRTLDVFFWGSPFLSLTAGGGSPPPLSADALIWTVRQAVVGDGQWATMLGSQRVDEFWPGEAILRK